MQLRTVATAVAVFAGLAAYVVTAPASSLGATAAGASSSGGTPESHASTSARGVSGKTINVVFAVVALNSLTGKFDLAEDVENGEQAKAIKFFVNQINKSGGINGRKINPIITPFDPTNDAQMHALCQQWTQGSPPVFAVIDAVGVWHDTYQLCLTQQGHTPLLSAWTTVSSWTKQGSPYLWWTAPDQSAVLQAVVNWGLSSGRLGQGHKFAIVAGDDAADQAALHQVLLPDLQRAGVTATVKEIAANPSEAATTNADAPLVVQQLQAAKVTDVLPLIPFNALVPVLQAENTQKYFPSLLLSDYGSSINGGLGLLPALDGPLNGQEGVTTDTLGGFDDNRPQSQGGYDPGVRSCYNAWHKAYPKPVGTAETAFIEEQGAIQSWCTNVRLFATAAKMAGHNLNRRTFVEAMAKIKNYPGGLAPVWSFGPHKYFGPTQYQIVKLHDNNPPSSECKLKTNHKPQGTCWVSETGWNPLPPS
jgi:hypothetical protein